jgi:hypothetical protein
MKVSPCFSCNEGDFACGDCLKSTENSTPVKIYTPKGAARAMLAGKTLKGKWGLEHFWGENECGETGFFRRHSDGSIGMVLDFSGLWEANNESAG